MYTLYEMTTKMEATKVRNHFAEELSKVAFGKQRLVIERNGKPLVAVVPFEELALLEGLSEQEEDRRDVAAYRQAKAEMARTGERPIPWARFKREGSTVAGPKGTRRAPAKRTSRTK